MPKFIFFLLILILIFLSLPLVGYLLNLIIGYLPPSSSVVYNAIIYNKKLQDRINLDALSHQDPTICDRLPESIPDVLPREGCYYFVARSLKLNNYSLCESLLSNDNPYYSSFVEKCLTQTALDMKNIIPCDRLQTLQTFVPVPPKATEYKQVEEVTIATEYGTKQPEFGFWCYYEYGRKYKDTTICNNIKDENTKNKCFTRLSSYMK